MASLSPGQRLAPHLTVVRKLGQGAMGKLWIAEDSRQGVLVAVKVLAYGLERDPTSVRRFQREFETASAIDSRHVIRMLEHGQTAEGAPYIVMEHLDGESLEERLDRDDVLSLDDTLELVRQSADALDAAHALGIVHRDVKPDNILLLHGTRFELKVLDFGLAKPWVRQTLTGSGVAMGTPDYMSPEQVLGGKHVDHRADVWALGVVAYRCLFGHVPFKADNVQALMFVICRGDFTRPSQLGEPRELDAWFERALRPHKDERFESAGEMAVAFELVVAALETTRVEDTVVDVRATSEMPLVRTSRKTIDDTAVTPVLEVLGRAEAARREIDEATVVRPPPASTPAAEQDESSEAIRRGHPLASLGEDDDERTRLMPPRSRRAQRLDGDAVEHAEPMVEDAPTKQPRKRRRASASLRLLFALVVVAAVLVAVKRGWTRRVWQPEPTTDNRARSPDEPEQPAPTSAATSHANLPNESAAPTSSASPEDGAGDDDRAFLSIRCRPGCAVWVDRESLGAAPVIDAPLAPGQHRVVVSREDVGSKVLKIDLRPGERASYEVLMKARDEPAAMPPPTGSVLVPPGIRTTLDETAPSPGPSASAEKLK